MNSSTSTSEPGTSEAGRWRHSLCRFGVFCLAFGAAWAALIVGLDPYDTGRFSLFGGHGVANFGPRFTAVSLAREPSLEGAVLGNSTSEQIDPERLTALTGLRFVSLAIHGTGPVEELAVAHWLVRHKTHNGEPLKVMVIGLDSSWCRDDGRLEALNPFPFWLYADSPFTYVANLVDLKAFEAVARRLKLLLGLEPPFRADGYRDYDVGRVWHAAAAEAEFAKGTSGFEVRGPGDFPAADRLSRFLPEVPPETAIVLLFVPRHHSSLPSPGSAFAGYEARCKQRYRDIAQGRARTAVVDLLKDGPMAASDEGYWDRMHYRGPVARMIESSLADAVAGLTQSPPAQASGG